MGTISGRHGRDVDGDVVLGESRERAGQSTEKKQCQGAEQPVPELRVTIGPDVRSVLLRRPVLKSCSVYHMCA